MRPVTRGPLVKAVNWIIPEAGATPLLRARYKCAPDAATQVLGILSTAICVALAVGIHEMMMSVNPEPTAAQDPIDRHRVRRRYLVVPTAS